MPVIPIPQARSRRRGRGCRSENITLRYIIYSRKIRGPYTRRSALAPILIAPLPDEPQSLLRARLGATPLVHGRTGIMRGFTPVADITIQCLRHPPDPPNS